MLGELCLTEISYPSTEDVQVSTICRHFGRGLYWWYAVLQRQYHLASTSAASFRACKQPNPHRRLSEHFQLRYHPVRNYCTDNCPLFGIRTMATYWTVDSSSNSYWLYGSYWGA